MLSKECADYFIDLALRFPHHTYALNSVILDIKASHTGCMVTYYTNFSHSEDFGKTTGCIHLPNSDKGQIIFLRNSDKAKLKHKIEPYYTKHPLTEFNMYDLGNEGQLLLLNPYSNYPEYVYVQEPRVNYNYLEYTIILKKEFAQDFVIELFRSFGINNALPTIREYTSLLDGVYD